MGPAVNGLSVCLSSSYSVPPRRHCFSVPLLASQCWLQFHTKDGKTGLQGTKEVSQTFSKEQKSQVRTWKGLCCLEGTKKAGEAGAKGHSDLEGVSCQDSGTHIGKWQETHVM
jgi:hypothetical protein